MKVFYCIYCMNGLQLPEKQAIHIFGQMDIHYITNKKRRQKLCVGCAEITDAREKAAEDVEAVITEETVKTAETVTAEEAAETAEIVTAEETAGTVETVTAGETAKTVTAGETAKIATAEEDAAETGFGGIGGTETGITVRKAAEEPSEADIIPAITEDSGMDGAPAWESPSLSRQRQQKQL